LLNSTSYLYQIPPALNKKWRDLTKDVAPNRDQHDIMLELRKDIGFYGPEPDIPRYYVLAQERFAKEDARAKTGTVGRHIPLSAQEDTEEAEEVRMNGSFHRWRERLGEGAK
jgi:hypothetical protein